MSGTGASTIRVVGDYVHKTGSVFFTSAERDLLQRQHSDPGFANQWASLRTRVLARASHAGLSGAGVTTSWWYHTAEFLSDAALVHAAEPTKSVGAWLRSATLDVVRRSEDEWIGPRYRDHTQEPPLGHLETAHLAVGVAIALDLAPHVFPSDEQEEIRTVLLDRAIPLCVRWLDFAERLNNWRCILAAGLGTASAVVGYEAGLTRTVNEFELCCGLFQADGSYAESLQYANYASWGLMLMYESLYRTGRASGLSVDAYARKATWDVYSHLYTKPLAGWGPEPRPRAVNFNDSAALYRPGGDVLMHIATRASDAEQDSAMLARWLYDLHYGEEISPDAGPFDLATFGLYNAAGFLSFILHAQARTPASPNELALPATAAFENGDVFARRKWGGQTVLAMRAGGAPLNGPSHLHGDMNSFTVTHRRERLLVDPGHSCYRNVTRPIEIDARSHNTCVFLPHTDGERDVRQEDLFKSRVISQNVELKRGFKNGRPGPQVDRGTQILLIDSCETHSAIVADAAAPYGNVVKKFVRSWLMLGESLIIVSDEIALSTPHRTEWNWLINNRDGAAVVQSRDRGLIVRRSGAGMQMHSTIGASFEGPLYGLLHDCYHPEPGRRGEGRPGSALTYRITAGEPSLAENRLHLIVLDSSARIGSWGVAVTPTGFVVHAPAGTGSAEITSDPDRGLVIGSRGDGIIPSASIQVTSAGEYQA